MLYYSYFYYTGERYPRNIKRGLMSFAPFETKGFGPIKNVKDISLSVKNSKHRKR